MHARYTAAGKRATHESVAEVSRTLLFGRTPGEFSPRGLFFNLFILTKSRLPLCSLRGQRLIEKKKTLAPGGVGRGHYGNVCVVDYVSGLVGIGAIIFSNRDEE